MSTHRALSGSQEISRRRVVALGGAAALSASLAACGGGSSATDTPKPVTAAATTASGGQATTIATAGTTGSVATSAPAASAATAGTTASSARTTAPAIPKGTELRFIGVTDVPWVNQLNANSKEFTDLTGVKVTFDTQTWEEKLLAVLTAGSNEVDVYMSNKGTYGIRFNEAGWYEDVNKYLPTAAKDYDFSDFAKSAIDTCTIDGKLVGIPTWADHNFFFYRTDLFDKAGIARLPTDKAISMEQFYEIATKLTDRGKQQYGVVTRGGARSLTPMWVSWFALDGGSWKDASGNWAMNTPGAVQSYLQYGKLLKDWSPPGLTDQTDLNEIYSQGRAATYINTVSLVPQLQDPSKNGQAATTAFAPMPGGRPYFFSWYLAISPFGKNKEASWEFIQWASSKKYNVRTAVSGLTPVRNSTFTDPDFIKSDAAAKLKDVYAAEQVSIAGGVADWLPPVRQVLDARDAIGAVILKAAGGASEADVKAAADKLQTQMQDIEKRK